MSQIIVELPKNRKELGNIYLEDSSGQMIVGSFNVLGLCPTFDAIIRGNIDRNPLRPNGNMPLGDYEIAAIYPTGNGTPFDEKLYGTQGLIVLVGATFIFISILI